MKWIRNETFFAVACVATLACSGRPKEGAETRTEAITQCGQNTFGNCTPGTFMNTASADAKRASAFNLTTGGAVVSKLTVYLDGQGATSGAMNAVGVVYAADGTGGAPGTLLCTTTPFTVSAGMGAAWQDLPISGSCTLAAAGTYYLGLLTGGTAGLLRYGSTSMPGALSVDGNTYASGPSNPFGTPGSADIQMSIYASYTASGRFGSTATGTFMNTASADAKRVSKFTLASANAAVTKLTAYIDGQGATSGAMSAVGVVYAANGAGAAPGTLLCTTSAVTVNAGAAASWVDLPVAGSCTLATPGSYYLGLLTGGTAGLLRYGSTTVTGALQVGSNAYASGPSNPFGSASSADIQVSIYATYGGGSCLTRCPTPDNCGTVSDGCGGTLNCGSCTAPQTCGGGGTPNVCGTSGVTGDYYVSTSGSDSNPGTASAPFRHLSKAASVVQAGQTVVVRDGVYDNEGQVADSGGGGSVVTLTTSGAATKPITFVAEHRGKAILDGSSTVQSSSLPGCFGAWAYFDLDSVSDVTIQGFVIRNTCLKGVATNGTGRHDFVFRWNEFANIGNWNNPASTLSPSGLYMNSSEYNFLIDGNIFHDIGGGSNVNQQHGVYTGASSVTIINNVFYNQVHGWDIQTAGASNLLIANNTFAFANPSRSGHIILWDDGITNSLSNVTIENNVFHQPGTSGGPYAVVSALDGGGSISGCAMRNNITTVSNVYDGASPCTLSGNLTSTTPSFVNASVAPYDFHLQAGSPGIDQGLSVSQVPFDFDGVTRPRGAAYDMGAFEYH